ncbi:M48 family metallopeptidase [Candidatus Micrarchaeota archaeon]|nr:M48 family metallopeptidase [Candidatus Micrarchaeota archaeon]
MEKELRTDFYKEISRNKTKSWLLVGIVIAFLFALVYVFSLLYGFGVLLIGGVFIIAYSLGTYYYGDKIVLADTKARPVNENNVKELQYKNIVENLALVARIPVPKTYVIDENEMNAFATGRDPKHASVAITTGLLNKLTRDELEGVIAHELSHVSNYDVRYGTIVAVMVGLIAILSHFFIRMQFFRGGDDRKGSGIAVILIIGIILAIIAPILVRIVQASISRKRESLADASGVRLTRYPEGLASALEKIKNNNKGDMKVSEAVSHLFFADPTKSALDGLFATHPPIEERIKTLRAM